MRLVAVLFALHLLGPAILKAQVVRDDFEDGDLTRNPAWMGTLERFRIVRESEGNRLRSQGRPMADTLYLATRSPIAYGSWSIWMRISGVNLSTANGVRWYLMADQAELKEPLRGYYVQIGTTNADDLRLVRQEGARRLELLRTPALWSGTEHLFLLRVERRLDGSWWLEVNGLRYGPVRDTALSHSSYLGIWVKHSATTGAAYGFDDVEAVWGDGAKPDERPFALVGAWVVAAEELRVRYSHPVEVSSAERPAAYVLEPGPIRASWVSLMSGGQEALLRLERPLESGRPYTLRVQGVRDGFGRLLARAELEVRYWDPNDAEPGALRITEVLYEPLAGQPEYVEFYHAGTRPLSLQGWTWHRRPDARGRVVRHVLSSEPLVLEPGQFLVLTADTLSASESRLVRFFGLPDPRTARLVIKRAQDLGLSNDGDAIVLRRPDGTLIDSLYYEPSWHHPALYDRRGRALERRHVRRPTTDPSNWATSADPLGGTPGRPNTVSAPDSQPGHKGLWAEPNPFSPDGDGHEEYALLRYRLRRAEPAFARVRIFDLRGRLIRELVPAGALVPPEGYWVWDGHDHARSPVPTGPYVVLLEASYLDPPRTETYRAVLVLVRGRGR
ncbi:MAG: lamin tail domain-containing protein [Bacteroidota bacterium]|nr:lamin tail domain-containing protein [Rhodothermia bacterium]MCS7155785.1 lamin tail domain-containing protein [Bacteroidota bacterium]MDW8138242.1 lamin tail domain-containing protein [Bacteroidota bacterium]MDW8285926.1 lamin tail domain-containing protein [Bacteroidota bacterium]